MTSDASRLFTVFEHRRSLDKCQELGDMSYYDLDEIISDGQRVPCKFNVTVPKVGYLEGTPGTDIKAGTKLELPFWIAEVLAMSPASETSDEAFLDLLQPEALHKRVLNAIKANPVALDVHSVSPYFYALVEKWSLLFGDKELSDVAQTMLKERADEINNFAQSTRGTHQESSFLFSLDEFEKQLYKTSHESYKELKKWMLDQ